MADPECIMDLKTWLFFFKNCDDPEDKRKAAEKRLALVKEMRTQPKGWTTQERKMLYKEQGRLEAMLLGKVLRPRNEVHPKHAHIERNRYGKVTRTHD
jgi:hypothetical protein